MSCIMRKPAFCICEIKGAGQLHGSQAADQHLCFCYIDSKTPLLPIHVYEISSLWPSSGAVQPDFCVAPGRKPCTDFLAMWLTHLKNLAMDHFPNSEQL